VDGLLETVTEVGLLALESVVSFAGCANVRLLQRSRRVVPVRNCAPIVGIAWVHSLTKRRAMQMRMSGVVQSDYERTAGKYCGCAQQLFARVFEFTALLNVFVQAVAGALPRICIHHITSKKLTATAVYSNLIQ
jgi:hypothetical protein